MKSVQKIDLGLTGYDELFMNDAERKENKLPRIYDKLTDDEKEQYCITQSMEVREEST